MRGIATLAAALACSACASMPPPATSLPAVDVPAHAETAPVGTARADAADDPAIWRNADDPGASLILGTDKKAGLYVYGLDGKVRDFAAAGALNNVDLREVRMADGSSRILVAASDRTDPAEPRIALFQLDGARARLEALGSASFLPADHAPTEAYGFCMGGPLAAGELARAYVVLKDGTVAESRLVERGGRIVPEHLRDVTFATQSEGCVVDDGAHKLYVAEENAAIWQVPLDGETLRAQAFARVGAGHGLVADIEGLAIARESSGKVWLVASSQGDNAYTVFDTRTMQSAGRFRINSGGIDGTSDTDGIEVALGDFGPAFPHGLFVAQDGDNAPDAQNFKLLSWQSVREALGLD